MARRGRGRERGGGGGGGGGGARASVSTRCASIYVLVDAIVSKRNPGGRVGSFPHMLSSWPGAI